MRIKLMSKYIGGYSLGIANFDLGNTPPQTQLSQGFVRNEPLAL